MPMAEARYPESMFRLRTNSPALANLGMRSTVDTALEICTKPLARQTLRVRYFRHYGLPQPPESLFAFRL